MVYGCELLSDFVYSFFEHNAGTVNFIVNGVVNCFQILYIRSLNTIAPIINELKQSVVNCFQILYIRSLNTIAIDTHATVGVL